MGEKTLSQAEITSLVGNSEVPTGQAAGLRRFEEGGMRDVKATTAYDFQCADRLGPETMRALEAIHEIAARHFAAAASTLVRSSIETHVARVDQATYAEFLRDLVDPTCFNLVRSAALATSLAIDVSPTILYPLIDRLLGGGREASQPIERPLTQIERRLAARVTKLLLDALVSSWQNIIDADFELARIETDPQLVHVVSPSELVVRVAFDVRVGDVRGPIRMCIPHAAIDAVRDRLVGPATSAGRRGVTRTADVRLSGANSASGVVELTVELARLRIAASEIVDLREGDVITTDQSAASPLLVKIDGVPRFHARAGAYKGRKAISIEDTIDASNPGT